MNKFLLFSLSFMVLKVSCNEKERSVQQLNKDNLEYSYNCLVNNISISVDDFQEKEDLLKKIKDEKKKKKKEINKKKLENYEASLAKINKKFDLKKLYAAILSMYKRCEHYENFINRDNGILTENELEALRLISDKRAGISLINKIFGPNRTALGKFVAALNLVNPSGDIKENIELIKVFQNYDIGELNTLVDSLGKYEDEFFTIYSNNDDAHVRYKMGDEKFNAYIDTNSNKIKKTSIANRKFLGMFLNPYCISFLILNIVAPLIAVIKGGMTGIKAIYGMLYSLFGAPLRFPGVEGNVNIYRLGNTLKNLQSDSYDSDFKSAIKIYCGLSVAFSVINMVNFGLWMWKIFRYFKPVGFYENLVKKYHAIIMYYSTMKEIFKIITSKEESLPLIKSKFKYCTNLFQEREGFTDEQNKLLNMLDTFPKKWSYMKNWGRARAKAFCNLLYLFDNHKDILLGAIFEIGEIETILATVNLLRNSRYKGKICFPTIVDLKYPHIEANNCCNPFLAPEVAVPNNVRLGVGVKDEKVVGSDGKFEERKNGYRVSVLYGMNAGGKTTYLESVGLLPVTAKAFGICFAESVTMTNFKRLFTIIDISTDISKGFSRFKSEVATSDKMIRRIKRTKEDGGYMLLLCDEQFAGTNHEAAGELSSGVLKYIMVSERVLSIFATHNSAVLGIEKDSNGIVRNQRMVIDKSSDGRLINRYKVIDGAKLDSVAKDIVLEMYNSGLITSETCKALLGNYS